MVFFLNGVFTIMFDFIRLWLLLCLSAVSYTDFRQQRIPDLFLLLMLPAAFFGRSSGRILSGGSVLSPTGAFVSESMISGSAFRLPPREYLFAALFPLLLYFLMALIASSFRQDCPVGMGDAKLLAVIALISGPSALFFTVSAGSLLCGIAAAILLSLQKTTKKDRIAFGPFLSTAYAVFLFF